jgi:hypothetical protein
MNKKISSALAISIILLLSLILGLIIWFSNDTIHEHTNTVILFGTQKPKKEKCEVHAYVGDVTIKVWQIKEGGKETVRVKREDLSKLPSANLDTLQLIDSNNEIKEKLLSSSEDNPIEITISGFANKCDKLFLASLNYSNGIFRPYL